MDHIKGKARWILWLLAALTVSFLAASLETGRVHALSNGFSFLGALSNVITPNGDGANDNAIYCVDNPRDSDISTAVFDVRGSRVGSMTRVRDSVNCPGASLTGEKLVWDGKSGGRAVANGVYVYQLQAEGKTITGTVMVVR